MRTGEVDLNTLRVDGEIFESVIKKNLWIQKYPDTCGRGPEINSTHDTPRGVLRIKLGWGVLPASKTLPC